MKRNAGSMIWGTACLGAALCLVAACKDDKPTKSTQPEPTPLAPTLDNVWPNADSTAWSYGMTQREWTFPDFHFYPSPDSMPPGLTLADVAELLPSHPIGSSPISSTGTYELQFDGQITTDSEVSRQNLRETLRPAPGADVEAREPAAGDGFLARLIIARPDLREKLTRDPALGSRARVLLASTGERRQEVGAWGHRENIHALSRALELPLFLHGYAWEKTDQWIGTYGDLDTLLAWKYLQPDLSVGSEFTFQLIPALADNVFLHGRVHRRFTFRTDSGSDVLAIECHYLVDYGAARWTDENGNDLGWTRQFSYGTVTYAPTVGPVASYERNLVDSGTPPGPGIGDKTLELISMQPPAARR